MGKRKGFSCVHQPCGWGSVRTLESVGKHRAQRNTTRTSCRGLTGLGAACAGMAILEWDELVKMPDGAADARGEQKEALAEVAHGISVCRCAFLLPASC